MGLVEGRLSPFPPWQGRRVIIPAAATGPRGSCAHFPLCLGSHSSCAAGSVLLMRPPPPSKATWPWVSIQSVAHPPVPIVPFVGVHVGSPRHRACGTPGPSLVAHWSLCGVRELWRPGELRSLQRGGGEWPSRAPCCPLPPPGMPARFHGACWKLPTCVVTQPVLAGGGGNMGLREPEAPEDWCVQVSAHPALPRDLPPPSPVCGTSQLAWPGNVCCEWDEPLTLSRPREGT